VILNNSERKLSTPDLSLLHRVGWLAETPDAFRSALMSRCTVRSAGPGETLYHVGDAAGGLFGVAQGQVGIHGAPHGADPTLMHIVGPGFWTGEFATLTGGKRLISLVARSPLIVCHLPRVEFLRVAEADPLAWRLLAMLTANNNARTLRVIGALRRESAAGRLAATLVNLAAELYEAPAVLRLSQEDLGALARLSRGSVNSALARLESAGLLRRDYGAIALHDVAALEAYEQSD
jgi:CRP/FNR family transcriptional regulator, cyclic AMP receptor protein